MRGQLALMPIDHPDGPDPSLLPPPPGRVVWERPGKDGTEKVIFLQAAPDPRDPAGLVRWVVQQPDGRLIPRHGKPVDELDTRHLHAVPDTEEA